MPGFDSTFLIVVAGSFVAAFFNAAFSAGGAIIILAVTSTVLPVSAVVPIHSALLIGSTTTRVALFRSYIDWKLTRAFLAGSVVGAGIGARIYVELPDRVVATAISCVMLVAIWLPQLKWRPAIRHPWVLVGFVHSLLSALFAYGAVLQSIMLQTRLDRKQVIGTMAGCLTGMGVFKIAGYALAGFDYRPYLVLILCSLLAAVVATAFGKLVVDRLSESLFRVAYRVLVTVTALRLLYVGLAGP